MNKMRGKRKCFITLQYVVSVCLIKGTAALTLQSLMCHGGQKYFALWLMLSCGHNLSAYLLLMRDFMRDMWNI